MSRVSDIDWAPLPSPPEFSSVIVNVTVRVRILGSSTLVFS